MEPWFQVVLTIFSSVLAMGGNGSAKRIMQEVDKLPLHKFIEKEEEHNEHE
jgi:hypothetical protein